MRERLRSLETRELVGLLVVAALVVAGAVTWYVRSLPAPVAIEASRDPPASTAEPTPTPTVPASPLVLVVHVAGWVVHPGVYELRQGDRVIDAIDRAGGPRAGADLRNVNLAALLVDAQQVVVAKEVGGGISSTRDGGPGGSGGTGEGDLVNVNTATLEQLETLPGIGEVLAQRIVDHRELHGPFRTVEDLLNVSGIGESRLEDLRPRITV